MQREYKKKHDVVTKSVTENLNHLRSFVSRCTSPLAIVQTRQCYEHRNNLLSLLKNVLSEKIN